MMSLKPSVVINAVLGISRSIYPKNTLVAMVVAWPMKLITDTSFTCLNCFKASMTPPSGFFGVDGTLMLSKAPVSSFNAIRSVKVPPTSTLILNNSFPRSYPYDVYSPSVR